jgi:hypothetical protein
MRLPETPLHTLVSQWGEGRILLQSWCMTLRASASEGAVGVQMGLAPS